MRYRVKTYERVVDKHVCRGGAREPGGRHGDWSIRAAFADKFKIFCYVFNREGILQDASE